jgi:hypothetical protein
MIGYVEYLPQLSQVPQSGDLFVGSIQLVAGKKNEVDIDKWKEVADHPLIKLRQEQGIIRVLFEQRTVITPPDTKKIARVSAPVETKLIAQEATPEVADVSAFVTRPPEVEKSPTPPPSPKK